jgi:3',5'-cyclic AMP phosphodiesterase CpdA
VAFSLIHISDVHFGGVADIAQIEALEALTPDLEPDLIVVSGDLSQRARHGEFQRARALKRELERTAPVYVIPGNHDVQWWWRPFLPFTPARKYVKYREYFGETLTPELDLPEALVVGVLTAHGVAWGSLTPRLRDIAVKGHLPKAEIERATARFAAAAPGQARILVMHHNLMRGALSHRMGLAHWKAAQRRVAASGADVVLCGHDHQEAIETLGDVIVICAGTLSTRSRGRRAPVFNRVVFEEDAIHVVQYRWDAALKVFRRSDQHQFARARREAVPAPIPTTG